MSPLFINVCYLMNSGHKRCLYFVLTFLLFFLIYWVIYLFCNTVLGFVLEKEFHCSWSKEEIFHVFLTKTPSTFMLGFPRSSRV